MTDEPEALTQMWSAKVVRSQHVPLRIVPVRVQVTEDSVESPNNEVWAVFHEHEFWSYLANNPRHVGPEPGALARDAGSLSGRTDVLAGESSADDVDMSSPWTAVEGSDVVPDGEAWQQSVSLPSVQHIDCVSIELDGARGGPPE